MNNGEETCYKPGGKYAFTSRTYFTFPDINRGTFRKCLNYLTLQLYGLYKTIQDVKKV